MALRTHPSRFATGYGQRWGRPPSPTAPAIYPDAPQQDRPLQADTTTTGYAVALRPQCPGFRRALHTAINANQTALQL